MSAASNQDTPISAGQDSLQDVPDTHYIAYPRPPPRGMHQNDPERPYSVAIQNINPVRLYSATTADGHHIHYTIQNKMNEVSSPVFESALYDLWDNNAEGCLCCDKRIRKYMSQSIPGNMFSFNNDNVDEAYVRGADAANAAIKALEPIPASIKIHTGERLFNHVPDTHWSLPIDYGNNPPTILDNKTISKIVNIVHRYVIKDRFISRIICRLIDKRDDETFEQAIERRTQKLDWFKQAMQNANYGQIYGSAHRIAANIFQLVSRSSYFDMNLTDATVLEIGVLLGVISVNNTNASVISQLNGIMDIFGMESMKDMSGVIEARANPRSYMRKKRPVVHRPTGNQPTNNRPAGNQPTNIQPYQTRAAAHKLLGDFRNTIMTVDELESINNVVTLRNNNVSQNAVILPCVGGGAGAGASAGDGANNNEITMADLITYLRNNPDTNLELACGCLNRVYIATTTMSKDLLKFSDYLWLFFNQQDNGTITQWERVTHVLPMYEQTPISLMKNVFFRTENRPAQEVRHNCCLPSYLKNDYVRDYGRDYEAFNTTTPISVPNGPIAYGYGTTEANAIHKLFNVLHFRINGNEVVVKYMRN